MNKPFRALADEKKGCWTPVKINNQLKEIITSSYKSLSLTKYDTFTYRFVYLCVTKAQYNKNNISSAFG